MANSHQATEHIMSQITSKGKMSQAGWSCIMTTGVIDGTSLVSSAWPAGLPQYVKGEYNLPALHAAGQLVPTHEDGLRAWCYVAINPDVSDKSNTRFLAYTNTAAEDLQEVAVRYQGFVQQLELGVYGTWDG